MKMLLLLDSRRMMAVNFGNIFCAYGSRGLEGAGELEAAEA